MIECIYRQIIVYDKAVTSAEKKNPQGTEESGVARVENVYQKDQHLARKIEYDKGVGHILYIAMNLWCMVNDYEKIQYSKKEMISVD